MFVSFVRSIASVIVAAMLLGGAMSSAVGQAQGEFAVFNDHDPESTAIHIYRDWDLFLRAVVFDVGPSYRFRVSTANKKMTGSRLGGGSSSSASWLEGNRVRFHLFTDNTLLFLENVKADMVEAAENGDIATWNRDEQLAYWLNLHNLLVIQVTGENYPYTSAKKLHRKNWTRDVVTVKGVDLSIQEIQDEIILPIWDDPMVVYGLFQGAIGGPSLRPLALRGEKIGLSLRKNGDEFVNSYRGVHAWGKTARVSKFYKWAARAFPNFEADLRSHLYSLADEKTAHILDKTSEMKAGYFSWNVPDFYAGRKAFGNSSSMSPVTALTDVDTGTSESFSSENLAFGNASLGGSSSGSVPRHTGMFLAALRRKFRAFDMPNKGITNSEMLTGASPIGRK